MSTERYCKEKWRLEGQGPVSPTGVPIVRGGEAQVEIGTGTVS